MWVAPTVVGRCTAGYWAVRCDTKGVTFLKSIWRTNVKDVELEGDILKDLGDKGVEHIPTVLCHGDVTREGLRNHQSLSSVFDHFDIGAILTTRLDKYVDRSWVVSLHPRDERLRKVLPRVPYRLVVNTAGYPLSTFKGSRELLKGTFDGFNGKKTLLPLTHCSRCSFCSSDGRTREGGYSPSRCELGKHHPRQTEGKSGKGRIPGRLGTQL